MFTGYTQVIGKEVSLTETGRKGLSSLIYFGHKGDDLTLPIRYGFVLTSGQEAM